MGKNHVFVAMMFFELIATNDIAVKDFCHQMPLPCLEYW
jgi:hypothetical protein